MKIDLDVLFQAGNDYLYEEQEMKSFLRTWKGGWWENLTAKEREDYTKHSERENAAWNTFLTICRLIGADADVVLPIIKSVSRYEKHRGLYDRCAWVQFLDVERFYKVVKAEGYNDGWGTKYYRSTGRKICA